jgi:hypothetical protein
MIFHNGFIAVYAPGTSTSDYYVWPSPEQYCLPEFRPIEDITPGWPEARSIFEVLAPEFFSFVLDDLHSLIFDSRFLDEIINCCPIQYLPQIRHLSLLITEWLGKTMPWGELRIGIGCPMHDGVLNEIEAYLNDHDRRCEAMGLPTPLQGVRHLLGLEPAATALKHVKISISPRL